MNFNCLYYFSTVATKKFIAIQVAFIPMDSAAPQREKSQNVNLVHK